MLYLLILLSLAGTVFSMQLNTPEKIINCLISNCPLQQELQEAITKNKKLTAQRVFPHTSDEVDLEFELSCAEVIIYEKSLEQFKKDLLDKLLIKDILELGNLLSTVQEQKQLSNKEAKKVTIMDKKIGSTLPLLAYTFEKLAVQSKP